jgi:hypothetical protein
MTAANDDRLHTLLNDADLPNCLAIPKPGQSVDDDDCLHVWLFKATVRDMTVFVLNAPPHEDKAVRDFRNRLVNLTRLKAKPGDNFFEVLGVPHASMEELYAAFGKDVRRRQRAWELAASPERTEEIRRELEAGAEELAAVVLAEKTPEGTA